jgi:hypothetical protein
LGLSLGELADTLQLVSSVAVIAGAAFIVVQLRQNSRLLESSARQDKKQAAVGLMQQLTDESYSRRRANFYRIIRERKDDKWSDFDDMPEDFEVRNFAYFYELYGQLVKDGWIDFSMVANMLQYTVVFDWRTFEPLDKHYSQRWGAKISPWRHFEWLSKKTEKYLSDRENSAST